LKLNIEQSNLNYVLSTVCKAIPSKPSIPALSGIKIESTADKITCTATDLEMSLKVSFSAMFLEVGQMIVPGKNLAELVKKLPNKLLEIEATDNIVSVRSQKSKYDLPAFAVSEYPKLPVIEGEQIKVNLGDLKTAIKKVIFATDPNDIKPFISSVLFEISPEKIRLVATDVNRLAIIDLSAETEQNLTALVPVRAAKEILNLPGDNAMIIISDSQLQIESGGVTLTTRLGNAQYPRYEQVIPKDFIGSFTVERISLIKSFERTALIAASAKLEIGDELTVSAKETDRGTANERLEIKHKGESLTVGFNIKYLLDVLKVVEDDSITFQYTQNQKPVLIQLDDYKYIVMPLKLAY